MKAELFRQCDIWLGEDSRIGIQYIEQRIIDLSSMNPCKQTPSRQSLLVRCVVKPVVSLLKWSLIMT